MRSLAQLRKSLANDEKLWKINGRWVWCGSKGTKAVGSLEEMDRLIPVRTPRVYARKCNPPSSRNRDILIARARGETMDQIAEQHGITRQRVWQIISKYAKCSGLV